MTVRPVATPVDSLRPAWAEIDLEAIRANAALLAQAVAPAELCAVVKAWGYGHGAVEVARAALAGGATWLAVALVDEGRILRAAGVTAPILVLAEPPADAMAEVVRCRLTATLYTLSGAEALVEAASAAGSGAVAGGPGAARPGDGEAGAVRTPVPVHVKVDTGMHRVGATPGDAITLSRWVAAHPVLELQGLYTHFAVADDVESPETARQLARFLDTAARLADRGVGPRLLHAANSAAALFHPASRLHLVRCGIALYGLAPAAALVNRAPCPRLQPALTLAARVSYVKVVAAGEGLSYGLRYRLRRRSVIATVPVGYADGVTRRLAHTGGQVLIGGRRYPMAGTVTMDQLLVDCGPDADVAVGDVAVLIGRQGDEEITAWQWAERVDTIAYEVVCGISSRVSRVYRPVDGA